MQNYTFSSIQLAEYFENFDVKGDHIVTVYRNSGEVVLVNPNGERIKTFETLGSEVTCIQFIDDAKRLVVGVDKVIKIFDVEVGSEIATLEGHQGYVMAMIANNKGVFSISTDGMIMLWNIDKKQVNSTVTGTEGVLSLEAVQNPFQLIGSIPHGINVWDVRKNELLQKIKIPGCVRCMTLNSDKSKLLTGTTDKNGQGAFVVFETNTWEKSFPTLNSLTIERRRRMDGIFSLCFDGPERVIAGTRFFDEGKFHHSGIDVWNLSTDPWSTVSTTREIHNAIENRLKVRDGVIYAIGNDNTLCRWVKN